MATVASPKRRKKSFQLKEKLNLDASTITKIANERKKRGLIVANCAEVPLWIHNHEIASNFLVQREKPAIFDDSPLGGTFSDGFAMYSTFVDVENTEVEFGVNMSGTEMLTAISSMFEHTANGVKDFFLYYSGVGKSFNGDWMAHDADHEQLNIVPFKQIVKRWLNRPHADKSQYLLIIADTNYAGIWVSNAKDLRLLQRHNILVQSSVDRMQVSLEMTIGEIKPPCWITQIVCGKFTHHWLQICASKFYAVPDCVVDMKGSFVVLNKQRIWDSNDEYYDESACPMSNCLGPYDEESIVVIPCYGYEQKTDDRDDDDEDEEDAAKEITGDKFSKQLQNVLDDIKREDEQQEAKHASNNNVQFVPLKSGKQQKLNVQRRTSHLPTPSVRRLNLLHGVVGGIKLKKHKKKKSRHVSTYSRGGFMFTKVLKDIRRIVIGSDDEDDDDNDEAQKNNKDWIDDD
eukprot:CAMPEP_0202698608 /NCGR_PEP_ID=MMETSP1385-20130828/11874_1 /ASSEMBLY_ACC=CAM_ASM_000861 /TAXON_ID=933848 /ORGANISM="Elphidium margaritaceum" /LENGTH=458 /DNA_ID=CAMNT_0049355361 /DNA_START=33 /DNA_END=1409 /DNA_ORIENTATION=+